MQKEVVVEIQGFRYQGILSDDGQIVTIYNIVSEDDVDLMGRFMLDGFKLIEVYPMTNRKVVIGEIIQF